MVMRLDLPVILSAAEMFKIPLASESKVTSTCGTPRGAGGMPDNSNLEEVVVLGASTLSFVYLNKYTRLVVGVGGEDFRLLGGDGT